MLPNPRRHVRSRRSRLVAFGFVAAVALAACGSSATVKTNPGAGGSGGSTPASTPATTASGSGGYNY